MMEAPETTSRRRKLPSWAAEDWAYLLPMFVFLGMTWLGLQWREIPWSYPVAYAAKTVVVAALLIWLWPAYTKIRWNHWWLGVLLGIVGLVQWVGVQLLLRKLCAGLPSFLSFQPPPAEELYNPFEKIQSPVALYAFLFVRIAGAVLLVPVMEELFWRDYLWRRIIAPNDFRLAAVGEWDWKAFVGVAIVFALPHPAWWLTAIFWGLMIGALLAYTKSLGACILMHATTNALLAAYVLYTGDWSFW